MIEVVAFNQRATQVGVGQGKLWISPNGLPKGGGGLLKLAVLAEGQADVVVGGALIRIEGGGLLKLG